MAKTSNPVNRRTLAKKTGPTPTPQSRGRKPKTTDQIAAADPFPVGTYVEIVTGRKLRTGHIAQRIDASHWPVTPLGASKGRSVLCSAGQLFKKDGPPPAPTAAPARRGRKARQTAETVQAPQAPRLKAAAQAAAESGSLPQQPDFSAAAHKPYRKRLVELQQLVEAGDLASLEAVNMLAPRSTSPKALYRYRELAMIALRARAAKVAAELAEAREELRNDPDVTIAAAVLRDYQEEQTDSNG